MRIMVRRREAVRGSGGLGEEEGFYFLPVVDAAVGGYVDVGGGGEEDAFAAEGG